MDEIKTLENDIRQKFQTKNIEIKKLTDTRGQPDPKLDEIIWMVRASSAISLFCRIHQKLRIQ